MWTLERELLNKGICDKDHIKVLDKASVRIWEYEDFIETKIHQDVMWSEKYHLTTS